MRVGAFDVTTVTRSAPPNSVAALSFLPVLGGAAVRPLLALGMRFPAMYASREIVEVGGLMSYGQKFVELFRLSLS